MNARMRRLRRRYQQAKRKGDHDAHWKARREYLLEQSRQYQKLASKAKGEES